MILKAVIDSDEPRRVFFIDAPGGYGKTFLLETVLSSIHSVGKIALAVASSGIAAELLQGGQTAHSHFKISIPISDESMCSITLQSNHAKLMQQTALICWDEVLMSNKQHIECVDRSLRDIVKVETFWRNNCCVWWRSMTNTACYMPWGSSKDCASMC